MQGDYLTRIMRRLQKTVRTTAPLTGLIRWPNIGQNVDHSTDKTNYPFVYVHGFFGWGRYDKGSDKLTYCKEHFDGKAHYKDQPLRLHRRCGLGRYGRFGVGPRVRALCPADRYPRRLR